MGFDAQWGVLGAADVGAPHQRDRIWIVAKNVVNSKSIRYSNRGAEQNIFEANGRSDRSLRSVTSSTSKQSENLAYASNFEKTHGNLANGGQVRLRGPQANGELAGQERFAERCMDSQWWDSEPANASRIVERGLGRVANGLATRVDRIKALGNGQVPLCAATAWRALSGF